MRSDLNLTLFYGTVEWTVELEIKLLNVLKEYECELDIQPNLWQYWISTTVERDENVKRDQTI